MNTRQQGAIGVAKAVAYFGAKGCSVFVPVADCSRYDLIVDCDGSLLRVEVKTTTTIRGTVSLRTKGGNQSWNGESKRLSAKDCDVVFLVNLRNGREREYPIAELAGRNAVSLR